MTAALGLRNLRWSREQLDLAVVKSKLVWNQGGHWPGQRGWDEKLRKLF